MNTASSSNIVRLNITLPRLLVEELNREVPKRGKSGFISDAVEEKLLRKRGEEALEALRNMPPSFPHIKNAAEYISKMRIADDRKRQKSIYG